ncbi:alpha/beta hydrolase [Yoonia sp. BS5-3]|uniref:Alpha/beta hydrolase n=1 Tax=Yoonia phaeophyticola TaxID=3137369 RepID=A0ABZ2V239_9RHOB
MELDDAYANAAHIPDGASYPGRWACAAETFRAQAKSEIDLIYGPSLRQRLDIFYPDDAVKGLVVFVHGGYWLRFGKSDWSHLAAGPLAHGWAVAMPSYDLCPHVCIAEIGRQIATAIDFAAGRVSGPIRLVGHSAGGQLVARIGAAPGMAVWKDRLAGIVPISPVADLAPLMRTSMNADLRIDAAEAAAESPLHLPAPKAEVTVWVGGDERPAFLDQANALGAAWGCAQVIEPKRHHFDVVTGLERSDSGLTLAVVGRKDTV